MVSKRIVLHFPHRLINQPIICKLVKDYNLEFNIMKADITPQEEGLLILEFTGSGKDYEQGIEYLKKMGVKIQPLSKDVVRNEKKCTHCGACVTMCPTLAFCADPKTKKIIFEKNKCIACEICIKSCPTHAMEIKLDV